MSFFDILLSRRGVLLVLLGLALVLLAFQGAIPVPLIGPIELQTAEAFWLVVLVGAVCIGLGVVEMLGPRGAPRQSNGSPTSQPTTEARSVASGHDRPLVRPSVRAAEAQLETLKGFNRCSAIGTVYDSLPDNLSGPEVALLLGDLSSFDRGSAIATLADKIGGSLSDRDFKMILGHLSGFDRDQAVKALSRRRAAQL